MIHRADGSERFVESQISFLTTAGQRTAMLSTIRDITKRKQADDEIRRLKEFDETLINGMTEGMVVQNPEGLFSFSNPAVSRITGFEPEELLGMHWKEFIPADQHWKIEKIDEQRKLGKSSRYELDFLHKNGTRMNFLVSGSPIFDGERFTGTLAIFMDITQRIQTEKALEKSEQQFKRAITDSPIPIMIHDEDDNILQLSKGWTDYSGYTIEDISTLQEWAEKAYGSATGSEKEYIDKLPEINETIDNGEWTITAKDGSKRIWEFKTTPLGTNAGGRRILQSTAVDVTAYKEAEAKLAGAKQLLEETGRLAKVGGWELDLITMEPYFSAETFRIYELPGPTPPKLEDGINFYAPESRPVIALAVKNAIEKHIPYDLELPFITAMGQNIWVRTQGHVEVKDGQAVRLYGSFQDISERKMAEKIIQNHAVELEHRVKERTAELSKLNLELQHANRAKDEFLATMSHELRTPLNSILGLSEALIEQRREPLSERQQRSLETIESSGHHLLELINDILDVSKIEAGKLNIYPDAIDVNSLCRSSLAFVKEQAVKKSISLDYLEDNSVSRIHADPRRMKQILVNLLTNAVKFTPEHGQVTLQVHADAENDLVQFSIIDSGIGIAPADLKRLFKPFIQVDSSLSREYDGTGLGLALVQRLTDLHGGSVHVQSEVGVGSTFTVNLPWSRNILEEQEDTEHSDGSLHDQGAVEGQDQSRVRGTVLLAEDTLSNILTVSEYLESHGYQVLVAHDGLEAIDLAKKNDPDVILMDIQMPVLDGLEAIKQLRADSRFASTPIIALTALAMPGDRERCLEAGADGYMSKPVSLKRLAKTINSLLQDNTDE